MKEFIEIPFGAKDSELGGWEYTIPEGYTASIENDKVIVKKEENDDEKTRKWIINEIKIKHHNLDEANVDFVDKAIAWLEKQSEKGTNRNEREIPNPVWSEEDEYVYNEILKRVTEKKLYEHDLEYIYKWSKSLRPQNWTKEDKERYISCLQRLGTGNPEQPETINSKWFKEHVYSQTTWKPSDEQMAALSNINVTGYISYAGQGQELINLYNELKKLKA